MNVKLAEHFYSIQGEGPTAGHPALFMRFQKCNLHCESDQWVCDTLEQMKHRYNFDLEKDVIKDWGKLDRTNRIIFTGGEPMMYQSQIAEIIDPDVFEISLGPVRLDDFFFPFTRINAMLGQKQRPIMDGRRIGTDQSGIAGRD